MSPKTRSEADCCSGGFDSIVLVRNDDDVAGRGAMLVFEFILGFFQL